MKVEKYRIAEEFRKGYVAALAMIGCPSDATEHFRKGFEAGYKAKSTMNQAMDDYLVSKGFSKWGLLD